MAPAPAKTPDSKGKSTSRRPRGDGSALIIDMEAARRAISGFLVVGRLLSPFQVSLRIIVDKLRASSAWRLQGTVIVQEVASDDGRFVLNFSAEEDRRFVLKARSWHYKRGGIIFVGIDGKGNPVEVDLGAMAIWVQVVAATTAMTAVASGVASKEGQPLGQEGRVQVAPSPTPSDAGTGGEDQLSPPKALADSGQEGQGLAG
ncbi:Isopenicillin N epimerase [Hordeum vulgare]|nr:Isopenicillin N epimerase [Hordeum vulgare]